LIASTQIVGLSASQRAPADFLVLDENPLTDFNAITRIRLRAKSSSKLKEAVAVPGR